MKMFFRRDSIFVAVFVLITILVFLFFTLRIKYITVTGNVKYTEDEIKELIFSNWMDDLIIYQWIQVANKSYKTVPLIEEYKIVFHSWNHVELMIHEKSFIGYVKYMGHYFYFDKNGMVLESSSTKLDDIVQITGLNFGHIILYETLPVSDKKVFVEILNLTQLLHTYQIRVDKIVYQTNLDVVLEVDDIEILLGKQFNIHEKITELSAMIEKVKKVSQISGKTNGNKSLKMNWTLDLRTYNGGVGSNIYYILKRKSY